MDLSKSQGHCPPTISARGVIIDKYRVHLIHIFQDILPGSRCCCWTNTGLSNRSFGFKNKDRLKLAKEEFYLVI